MILPLLEYCNILFNSGKKLKLDKIDRVQSKCIRIIENCHDVQQREKEVVLCRIYNLDTLQNRRDIQLACTMFRLSKNGMYIVQIYLSFYKKYENKKKPLLQRRRPME